MGTANYDASRITQRKRAVAMSSWNATNKAAVNAGTSVRREQNAFATLDIVTARKQGGCYCTDARNGTYDRGGDCGCGGTK